MLISFPYRLLSVVDGTKCDANVYDAIRRLQARSDRDNHQVVTGLVLPNFAPSDYFLLAEGNVFVDCRVEIMEREQMWSHHIHARQAETAFYRGTGMQTNQSLVAMGMFLTRNTGDMGDEFLIALDEIREASRISPLAFEAWFKQVSYERERVARLAKAIFRIDA